MNTLELSCPACGHREVCRPTQMLQRLQQLGMLRRTADPDPQVLDELFRSRLDRIQCVRCGQLGLTAAPLAEDEWEEVQRNCEQCGQPIPSERLELLPAARRCAKCQEKPTVEDADSDEFCPRCGAPMKLEMSRGSGLSRYVWQCTACRR